MDRKKKEEEAFRKLCKCFQTDSGYVVRTFLVVYVCGISFVEKSFFPGLWNGLFRVSQLVKKKKSVVRGF